MTEETTIRCVRLPRGWVRHTTQAAPKRIPQDAASCEIPGGIAFAWTEVRGALSYRERLENGDCEE